MIYEAFPSTISSFKTIFTFEYQANLTGSYHEKINTNTHHNKLPFSTSVSYLNHFPIEDLSNSSK